MSSWDYCKSLWRTLGRFFVQSNVWSLQQRIRVNRDKHCRASFHNQSNIGTSGTAGSALNRSRLVLARSSSNNVSRIVGLFTAQKLIDAWQNTGPTSLRLPDSKKSSKLPRERCESILAYLLLEGYLKEDFHFTPYSTISYLVLGASSSVFLFLHLNFNIIMFRSWASYLRGKGNNDESWKFIRS